MTSFYRMPINTNVTFNISDANCYSLTRSRDSRGGPYCPSGPYVWNLPYFIDVLLYDHFVLLFLVTANSYSSLKHLKSCNLPPHEKPFTNPSQTIHKSLKNSYKYPTCLHCVRTKSVWPVTLSSAMLSSNSTISGNAE